MKHYNALSVTVLALVLVLVFTLYSVFTQKSVITQYSIITLYLTAFMQCLLVCKLDYKKQYYFNTVLGILIVFYLKLYRIAC